jgi:hypothetical protein
MMMPQSGGCREGRLATTPSVNKRMTPPCGGAILPVAVEGGEVRTL